MHATETQAATFRLPFPPSINNYWENRSVAPKGFTRNGKRRPSFVQTYLSEKAKRFRVDVQAAVIERFGRIPQPTESKVRVCILAIRPDHKTRDIDNFIKPTLDALTHARVWVDDSQVKKLEVELSDLVDPPGHLEVTIERIPDPQARLF